MPHHIDPRPAEEPDDARRAVEAEICEGIARQAADSLIALVIRRDPSYKVSVEGHEATTALMHAIAAAIARK